MESKLNPALHSAAEIAANLAATEVQNAFVAGLEESAVDAVFKNLCVKAVEGFRDAVETHIQGRSLGTINLEPTCSCDVHAPLVLEDITVGLFGPNNCETSFSGPVGPGGQIGVLVNLPNLSVTLHASDSCEVEDHIFGACIARTVVDVRANLIISNASYAFTITESQIETNMTPGDDQRSFALTLRFPGGERRVQLCPIAALPRSTVLISQ